MLIAERYLLGPSLGRGGMGEVFRATDEQLGRPVAVKLLLPSDRDERAGERFQREARAAARLSDPHVVSVYDFGPHGDGFFLVMELVEGRTVAAELDRSGPMPKERAIDIVEQAAAGLAAAHREDVVHRDVKPSNLLLTADGTVKVADFGIAHLPGDGTTTLTATGQIVGSTHYLAPERARGGQAGKAADVYGLGCVLYQLVTGQPPFTAEHPAAILYQHVDADPTPPSLSRPELGGSFENVLLRMLAKDEAARPTAAEIAGGALRAQPDLEPVAATLPVVTAEQPIAPEQPPLMRRKALLVGGIAVLVTGAAVLAGVVLNDDPKLPPTTDVGPGSGSRATTPRPAATKTATAGTGSATSSTSARPTQRTSVQPTPSTPSTGTSTTNTPSPSTSASTTAPSSTPPSASASATQTASPSPTPPSSSPTPTSPSTASPSPSPQRTETPAAAD
ncbi:serine/threonine-protein kinase [Kribbella speibonae]|uniref:non-specific serine/threonine protein kinase n=1 Tax=Kribbella speibonae TaxID=1572660 RepID=A0ABY2A893_9ACTN|nr:serine/threonine-protein kinase [Kribbella speibonae]TCC25292.1 serine/threonine protein kinase [Kribbella speibonae]